MFTSIKDFAVGQLLKKSSFTLYETMSAIEVILFLLFFVFLLLIL